MESRRETAEAGIGVFLFCCCCLLLYLLPLSLLEDRKLLGMGLERVESESEPGCCFGWCSHLIGEQPLFRRWRDV